MVFLKRIDLSGFKTFARRTSVTFDQHLNVIIGPNGSGKTNIIDAIQFVLGERSPRLLRATNFAGLLFSGKGDMPRARHASVSLHLANRDRRIPVDTDEVVISRHVGPDGNSTFRLNGKRCSLSNLLDVLSSAALTGGMNVIHQGTTMRLADFSPEDRRRDVERILGIADYDRKKEEATVELRDAETNLKVAWSKYDTVKERLLELERERNELLSYNYIKGELSRLKAAKLSTSLNGLRKRHQELSSLIGEKNQRLTEIRSKREQLDGQLREKRREWQNYTERVVEKGGEQLLVLQKAIGDVNSDVAGLQTAISLAKTNLQAYENMRHDKQDTLSSIRDQIISARKESKKLQREKSRLEELLKEREKTRTQLLTDIANIKENVEENANRLRTVEEQLDTLAAERAKLDVAVKAHGESVDILADQMQTLEVRKKESENVLATVASRYKEVSVLKRKEDKRLESLVQAIDRNTRQKQTLEMEVRNADRVVKQARKSVTEFESRKSLAESVLSEEKALEHIEALVDARALKGIHGRLSEKVKIKLPYKMAVEAAAEGWLQALIAEDMETVRRCAESLKRSKIGRVKLIPLSNVQGLKSIEKPSVPGVQGTAASYVECATRYRPAVNFVFGDTFVAADEDAALRLSDMGYRAVTPDGEVYEPGFRLEVGFYREHIDLAEVVPSDNAIKGISETVNTFEDLLQRRSVELQNLGDELIRLEGEKALQAESMRYFEYELSQMEQNLERTHRYVVELNRKLRSLRTKHQNISGLLSSHASRQSEIDGQLHTLRLEIVPLRRRVKPEAITMLEGESVEVEAAISELRRTLSEVESKIATLESNVQNIHVPSFSTVRGEMMGINRNISSMTRKIQDSTEKLQSANSKLKEMERQKEKHSEMMLAGKEESKKFDKEISDLEKEINRSIRDFDPLNEGINLLQRDQTRIELEIDHTLNELRSLGCEEEFDASGIVMSVVESSIQRLTGEFEELSGKVNMRAAEAYDMQMHDYKQLSVRINQLEEEKRSIIEFMETVEREKRQTFISALEKVSKKFSEAFNTITGGRGWLQLQNPDDPFAGGLDVILEFPGKSQMPVTAASGGEKSVVAVCYIFAIQSLSQTSPFYIFDEIDAHLDAVNVQRLGELLAKEAQTSQIISITFKEAIAAKATRVFGIYGREGVSILHSLPQLGVLDSS